MPPVILDGQRIANEFVDRIKLQVRELRDRRGVTPALATVLVGDDPASRVYVRKKIKTCEELGMESRHVPLPADSGADRVRAAIRELNEDETVHGILLQLPLPPALAGAADALTEMIRPAKDVDGFHPENMGRLLLGRPRFVPCTPAGIMVLLDQSGVDLAGRTAVVVGRSNIVGKPMGILLLQRHATVIFCHSRTRDLEAVCRQADVLIAAVGKPGMITGRHVAEGAVVVDVGINAVADATELRRIVGDSPEHWRSFEKKGTALVGDVEWTTAAPRASAITPVPGGVGPLTIALLMDNTLRACRDQLERTSPE